MKIRRLLIAATIFALSGVSALAVKYPKVYINPGHGCWTSRAMPTIKHGANNVWSSTNDTTNFFETNTNLRKGLALLWQLVEYGVPFDKTKNQTGVPLYKIGAAKDLTQTNLVMSHVKAGAWPAYINGEENPDNLKYNRYLSEIAAEAKSWGADMFISIHSNAAASDTNQTSVNFLYFALDGYAYSSSTKISNSKKMATKAWDHCILDRHQPWTHYDYQSSSGSYLKIEQQQLGVLNHTIPGYLSEGYFHDYSPARHRYMNKGVCALEGIAYARGVADYYGLTKEKTGDIYGVVRDKNVKITHKYYVPMSGTNDVYKPLNNCTVTLKKSDGTVVATTKTDDEYNGAFIFNNVTPGTYKLEFSHADCANYVVTNSATAITTASPTSISVTVSAAKTSYPIAFLTSSTTLVPPVQGAYAYGHSLTDNGTSYKFAFKSTATASSAKIVLTNKTTGATSSHNLSNVKKGDNSLTINKSSIADGTYTWAVSIANAANTKAQCYFTQGGTTSNDRRGGVGIDLDTESKYFGHVYTSTAKAGGIQRYNPDLTKNGSALHTGSFTTTTSSSPYRLKVSNSKVYIADWSDDNSGIFVYNPATGSISQMFQGTRNSSSGQWTNGSTIVGGSTSGLAFYTSNGQRKMYSLCEDYTDGNMFVRYDLGTADTWNKAPSTTFATVSALLGHNNVEIVACEKGLWICQNWQGVKSTADAPGFIFMDHSGNVKFKSTNLTGNAAVSECPESGIALSADMSRLAVVSASGNVSVYKVTWSGTTPTLTWEHDVYTDSTSDVEQIVFDPAGNMLIFSRQQGLMAYTMINPARNTVTAAPVAQVVTGGSGSNVEPEPEPEPEPENPGNVTTDVVTGLTEVWNYSYANGKTANWITNGSQSVTDMAFNNGKLYVASDKNSIIVVDAYTGAKKSTLDVTPCTVGTYLISSVKVLGGKVIACNLAGGAESVFNVYLWDNDNSTPTTLLSTTSHNGTRTGDAMSVSGDLTNGKIWFAYDDKVFYYTVKNGAVTSTEPTFISLTKKDGSAYTFSSASAASNVTVESDGSFWVASKDWRATHFSATGVYIEEVGSDLLSDSQGTDIKFIGLGSKKYAVATYYQKNAIPSGASSNTLADGAFNLLDVTSGISAATKIATYPTAGLGNIRNTTFRNTLCTEVNDTDLNVWVMIPFQGAAYYKFTHTTGGTTTVIENIDTVEETPVEYYNLQGVKVDNPSNGLYIKRQGNKVTKVIL